MGLEEYIKRLTPAELSSDLSLYAIKLLSSKLGKARKLKEKRREGYHKNDKPRFSREDKRRLRAEIRKLKPRLAYPLLIHLETGLRISESVSLNINDIRFDAKMFRVYSIKQNEWLWKFMLGRSYSLLKEYTALYEKEIMGHEGFLFWTNNRVSVKRGNKHLNKDYMRCLFSKLCRKAGLTDTYGKSIDGRRLYCDASHSARRTGARELYEKSNHDLDLVCQVFGWKDPRTAMQYIRSSSREVTEKLETINAIN